MRTLKFYTDGAFSSKTMMGGWAAICIEDGEIIDTQQGYEPYSTNNRMELMAFLSALENIDTIVSHHVDITIYVDSAYISNCFTEGWYQRWMQNGWRTADRQEVKNQDLWRRIIALYIKLKGKFFRFEISKVKAHGKTNLTDDEKWNNYVDLLAQKNRKRLEVLD